MGIVLVDVEGSAPFCLKFLDEKNGQKSLKQHRKLQSLFQDVEFNSEDIEIVVPGRVLEIQEGLYVEVQKRVVGNELYTWFDGISDPDVYVPLLQGMGHKFFYLHGKAMFYSEGEILMTKFSHGDAHFSNIFLEETDTGVKFSLIDTETFGEGTCFRDFATMLFTPLFYGGWIFSGQDCQKLLTGLSNFLDVYLYSFHEKMPEHLLSVCHQFQDGINSWFDALNDYWNYLEYSIKHPKIKTKDNPHSAAAFAISSDQIKYFKKFRKTIEKCLRENPDFSPESLFSGYRKERIPALRQSFLGVIDSILSLRNEHVLGGEKSVGPTEPSQESLEQLPLPRIE